MTQILLTDNTNFIRELKQSGVVPDFFDLLLGVVAIKWVVDK
ncbi:MAG: hypothetical protein ABI760_26195 [Ferruginibacter sp.]